MGFEPIKLGRGSSDEITFFISKNQFEVSQFVLRVSISGEVYVSRQLSLLKVIRS